MFYQMFYQMFHHKWNNVALRVVEGLKTSEIRKYQESV